MVSFAVILKHALCDSVHQLHIISYFLFFCLHELKKFFFLKNERISQEFYDITINNHVENERYASLRYAERNSRRAAPPT